MPAKDPALWPRMESNPPNIQRFGGITLGGVPGVGRCPRVGELPEA